MPSSELLGVHLALLQELGRDAVTRGIISSGAGRGRPHFASCKLTSSTIYIDKKIRLSLRVIEKGGGGAGYETWKAQIRKRHKKRSFIYAKKGYLINKLMMIIPVRTNEKYIRNGREKKMNAPAVHY